MKNKLFTLFFLLVAGVGNMFAVYRHCYIGDLYYDLDEKTRTATVTYASLEFGEDNGFGPELIFNRYWYINTANIPDEVEYESVPYRVTSIGSDAFHSCGYLKSVTIPNSVKSIEYDAFCNCYNLTSVTLGNGIKKIDLSAFWGCYISTIHISDLAAWCNVSFDGGNPFGYTYHLYLKETEITDLVIPNSVKSIGSYVFSGCEGLTSVTIPNSVTSIAEGAFYWCSNLKSITCMAVTPPTCGFYVFVDVDKNIPLYVPEGTADDYRAAKGWSDFNNIVEIQMHEGINNVSANFDGARKLFRDGQVLIHRGEKVYTVMGQENK